MKFQIGDKVLLLHSNEEGEVIDIINNEMVLIDVDGVKFPAYIDQIDFPYFKKFTEQKLFPTKKEKKYIEDVKKEPEISVLRKEAGVWLAFLPVIKTDEAGDEVVQEIKLHLVNETNRLYNFIYELHFFGKPDFDLKNEIHPFEDFYLHDIAFDAMNDSPSFEFRFSLLKPEKDKADYFETSVRIKPRQLFTKLTELKEKNEASFSYLLFENYPGKQEKHELYFELTPKQNTYDASQARQFIEPAVAVIDLHIEKLTDEWNHLSNFEIMTLQLKTFEKYYDLAVAHIQPSLTVIHGVGEGKLRDEVHSILRTKREVKSFVNQYHPLYGYGATEIYFQY